MNHKTIKTRKRNKLRFVFISSSMLLAAVIVTSVALMAGLSGAIFTTDAACNGTDLNIYASKSDVYIDGGPAHTGAAGLPPGNYFVQVTEPNGTVLGTSVGAN